MEAQRADTRQATPAQGRYRALAFIATSQLLVLTLWFSASAVAPQLTDLWTLSETQATALFSLRRQNRLRY